MKVLKTVPVVLLSLFYFNHIKVESAAAETLRAAQVRVREVRFIRSFSLMDAERNRPLRPYGRIRDGGTIDLARLSTNRINIRANGPRKFIEDVSFELNRSGVSRVDSSFPFSLYGDSEGDYNAAALEVGTYELSAIATQRRIRRRRPSRIRRVSIPLEINFEVIDSRVSRGSPTPEPTPRVVPDPTATPVATPVATPNPVVQDAPPIAHLAQWESNMRSFGSNHCDQSAIAELGTWEGNVWYYDGIYAFYRIGDYLQESSWQECARYVRDVYRSYVLQSNGQVPGWRVFPNGLAEDYWRTGSTSSKNAAILLANNSVFASVGGGSDVGMSRETAYLINAYVVAEQLGEPRHPKLAQAVNFALGHLDKWAGSQTATWVQPFMVGLTFEALIRYYDHTGDQRVPPAIENAANWLWSHAWEPSTASFRYIVCEPGANAGDNDCHGDYTEWQADLNLLIAPAYAWLYQRTGNNSHRVRGDAIFSGGVLGAWLGGGKQFAQNYRSSFDYVRWRSQ